MKAIFIKKLAIVLLPAVEQASGVTELYLWPILTYTKDLNRKYISITLYLWKWALISVIKTL
jgi:hypothetical protein